MEDRYMTSAQFAKLCGITKDTLQWYEKKELINPVKVGENGYHYYSFDQFYDVDLIKTMKNTGISLEKCREYMEERSEHTYLNILMKQEELLSRRIDELILMKADVSNTLRDCLSMMRFQGDAPRMVQREEMFFLTQPLQDFTGEGIAKAFTELYALRKQVNSVYKVSSTMLNGMILPMEKIQTCAFHEPDFVCLKLSDAILDPRCRAFPKSEYALIYHRGSRDQVHHSYYRLLEFIEQQGAEVDGDALEADYINYLADCNGEAHIKQISVPIRRRS